MVLRTSTAMVASFHRSSIVWVRSSGLPVARARPEVLAAYLKVLTIASTSGTPPVRLAKLSHPPQSVPRTAGIDRYPRRRMPEGSDSADQRGRPAPFDQDAFDRERFPDSEPASGD